MNAPLLLARLRQSRRTSLTVFAITLAALVVTAVWFISARSSLAEAYARLGDRNQALAEAQVREQEAQLRVEYARSARELLTAAQAHGLQPQATRRRLRPGCSTPSHHEARSRNGGEPVRRCSRSPP